MKKPVLILVGLIIASPLLAETVKIGYIGTITGAFQSYGDRYLKGTKQAIKEFNSEGGDQIELIIEDNKMKPEVGIKKLKKL